MIRLAMLALALVLAASSAGAQIRGHIDACVVAADEVPFGPFFGARVDVTGRITLVCTGSGNNNPFTVAFSEGGSHSFLDRRMFNGDNELRYNLYVDAARTTIWGSGAGETQLVIGQLQFQGGRPQTAILPVFARLMTQPTPPAGPYVDHIVVTVTF